MKVKLKDIKPNPYRNIEKYKINRDKVDSLKTSISETGFWDNILLREKDDKYEAAYGHHRLQAAKELGIEEVDVPVKDLDNATMIRIMANENLDTYDATTVVINETVSAAKDFIDAELAKYETWEGFRGAKNSIPISDEPSFRSIKGQGAGRKIICAFLGGNWKPWMVEGALRFISDDRLDREAVEAFPTLNQAKTFGNAAIRNNIPKEEQKELAERIIEDGKDSRREMKKYFGVIEEDEPESEISVDLEPEEDYSMIAKIDTAEGVDLDTAVQNNIYSLRQVMTGLAEILQNWDSVSEDVQVEYKNTVAEFFHINRKYLTINGGEKWNLLTQES